MRRVRSFLVYCTFLAAVACSDHSITAPSRQPTAPSKASGPADQAALEAQINGLINALYAPTAQGPVFAAFAKVKAAIVSGRTDAAQTQIVSFFSMVLQDFKNGKLQDPNGPQPPSTIGALQDLLNNVAQFGGFNAPIPPSALEGGGTIGVVGTTGGTVVAPSGFGGVRFPPGALPADVVVIITRLPNPTQPRTGPLPTTSDQYPLFYDFSTFPHVVQFAQPVIVGLCRLEVGDPFGPANYTVADRLQVAHPNPANPATVELLRRVDVDFVHCDGVSLSMADPTNEGQGTGARALAFASKVGSSIAKWMLPTSAYAVHAGLGGETSSFSPFGMVDPGGVTPLYGQLAVGNFHGCVITSANQTWCWGDRSFGQLGNGVVVNSPSAAVQVNGSPSYTVISSHGSHTCGMPANDLPQCWGRNGDGIAGGGMSTLSNPTPVNVLGGPYLQISGGRLTTCTIDLANIAWCWGLNQQGEVGNPAFAQPNSSSVPVMVATNLKFRSIEASWVHTCALVLDVHPVADTYCWGSGSTLGFGGPPNFPTPVLVGGGVKFSHLFAGGTATCGVTDILTAYCWGFNPSGGLGNGTTTNTPTPSLVAGNLSWEMLSTGTRPNSALTHTCGITLNGVAYCWGANDLGQLGDGTTTGRLVPTAVATAERFVAIGTGDTFSCAMRADRQVFCWGDNSLGQLGSGTAGGMSTTPVPVAIGGPAPPPAIVFASINGAGNNPANLSALNGAISVTLSINPPFGTTTTSVQLVTGTGTVLASQALSTTQHASPVLSFNTSQMPLGPGSLQAKLFLVGGGLPVLSASIPVNVTP